MSSSMPGQARLIVGDTSPSSPSLSEPVIHPDCKPLEGASNAVRSAVKPESYTLGFVVLVTRSLVFRGGVVVGLGQGTKVPIGKK